MAFVAPYLTLMREDAPQRDHELREVFNGVRYVVRTGCPWRSLPHDLPPWEAVYQQSQRWIAAKVFEAIVHDLRAILRLAGKQEQPTAAIFDGRTMQSTPESGERAGYNGHKKAKRQQNPSGSRYIRALFGFFMLPQPMSKNVPKSRYWPKRFRK